MCIRDRTHYHISDRPITYNELTSLFKTIKRELPVQNPETPNEFVPRATTPDDIDITDGHELREAHPQVTVVSFTP